MVVPSQYLAAIRLVLIIHAACLALPILAVMIMAFACARKIYAMRSGPKRAYATFGDTTAISGRWRVSALRSLIPDPAGDVGNPLSSAYV